MNTIDIVVTWVDGSDPAWLEEKAKYTEVSVGDNRDLRFRDWDTLRYFFRGIEKHAPWVRKIHFVTWGHLPEWLDTSNPKLNIVKHSDFIPKEYLPTFSSHPIEWNIHRIEGLSDKFVYFNDDIVLINDIPEEYWFKNGIPCDQATIGPYVCGFRNSIGGIVSNNMEIINTRFSKNAVIKQKPFNWFNIKYGKFNLFNIAGMLFPLFTGFQRSHYPNGYLKSSFETLWEEEYDVIHQTCLRKIRDTRDVNHWLIRYWQLVTNKFVPRKQKGCEFLFTSDSAEKIERVLLNKKNRLICINDSDSVVDAEKKAKVIQELFEKVLPEKSSFERG